ncbi:MAG: MCE family protein [Fimbriimonadaceae bacterium]|nr:MCE family protein [Fimbriimonadaceae bacterium]
MTSAAKVGAFVVLFGVLGLAALNVLQAGLFAPKTDAYFAEFDDAGGVAVGSPVMLAGVQVGQVEKVNLTPEGRARLALSIEAGTALPRDSVAVVPASLLAIGDTRVLLHGTAASGRLMPGSVIRGALASPLESMGLNLDSTLDEMNRTLVAVRQTVEDEELKQGVKQLIGSLDRTTARFGGVAGRVDTLLARNQSVMEQSLRSASASLANLQAVSTEVRKLVASGELQGKTTALMDSLQAAVNDGRGLVGDLRAMANDPKMRASIDETLENVKVISASGTRVAADAELMAKNGVKVSEEATLLMKKANSLADEVDSLIKKFNKTVDDITERGKGFSSGVQIEATVMGETRPGRLRTDLNATIPIGQERLSLGLYDAFESNKVNLQFVRSFGSRTDLRYGVYASKPGIGVDYALAPRVGLRADVFGLNDPRFDARLGIDLGRSVTGWFGLDRVFERNSPSLGVTIRK